MARTAMIVVCGLLWADAEAQTVEAVTLRGHSQSVRLHGVRGAAPIVVSSGDGGWIQPGPHVAEVLAAHG
jgi:hypothetical protein